MDSNEVVKTKAPHLIVAPIGMTMRMKATCSACDRKLVESEYHSKADYSSKRYGWVNNYLSCPYCKAKFKTRPYNNGNNGKEIKWRKGYDGLEAEVKNGTFYLFKFGNRWMWSFKYVGEKEPRSENQGGAFSKEVAERMCERHKEWVL